jgi:hypothetical protein
MSLTKENALELALQTSTPGENPRLIIERAEDYVAFVSESNACDARQSGEAARSA